MNYKKIIKKIAKNHNVSKKEVDNKIRAALKSSGINVSPEIIIEIIAAKVKKDYLS
ncbi:MAG: hypothetical protein IK086_06970 [Clostridia bacterium]|nr:hypothetical protein [Clostridia bacterium]